MSTQPFTVVPLSPSLPCWVVLDWAACQDAQEPADLVQGGVVTAVRLDGEGEPAGMLVVLTGLGFALWVPEEHLYFDEGKARDVGHQSFATRSA
jgi:hypothetical protein